MKLTPGKLPVCLYDFGKQYTIDIEPTFDRFWCVSYEIDLYDIFVLKSSENLLDAVYDMQWFISPEGIWAYNKNNDSISVSPKWRKATVDELIEHFKTKEE